jgi:hypothetical protein
MTIKKPDFMIIGAMKSATSTLHEQLALQKGIYMSMPKEPNYFSDDDVYQLGQPWYLALFEQAKTSDLCGESSTHYTKLPDYPETIARMKQFGVNPKFIYVMRHPIDRLVSHYIHQWSQNVIKSDINSAITEFPELIDYSCYSRQLEPYFQEFGKASVLPVFSESIRAFPQQQLEKVAHFIGYKERVVWDHTLLKQNVSSQRVRKFKGYNWLVGSKLMTHLRRALVPQGLRNVIKTQLMMKDRPALSPENIDKLTKIFDQDLSQLKDWLGIELKCGTFKEQVKEYDFIK